MATITIKARELSHNHLGHMVTVHHTSPESHHRFLLAEYSVRYDSRGSGPVIRLQGGDRVWYPARHWEQIEVEGMPDPETTPEVIVKRDASGDIIDLVCPNPSCAVSDIAEVDQSVRWNRLTADHDGNAVGVIEGQTDHQHVGFICRHCTTELTLDDAIELVW